jgi:hypothetical protein
VGNLLVIALKVPLALKSVTELSLVPSLLVLLTMVIFSSIIAHVLGQLLFKNKDQPPVVFSWFPLIGSTLEYGTDPYRFLFKYREKVFLSLPRFQPRSIRLTDIVR